VVYQGKAPTQPLGGAPCETGTGTLGPVTRGGAHGYSRFAEGGREVGLQDAQGLLPREGAVLGRLGAL